MTNYEYKSIIQQASQCDTIVLDCFDTILSRKYSVNYSFICLANLLIQEYGIKKDIVSLSNSLSFLFYSDTVNYSVLTKFIYNYYSLDSHVSYDFFNSLVYNCMLNAELSNCYVDKRMESLLNWFLKNNKVLYIYSDFYFGKKFITLLLKKALKNNPSVFKEIFVSCDIGFSKSDKKHNLIFSNLEKSKTLFIDDNSFHYATAKSLGYKAVWLKKAKEYKKSRNYINRYYGNQNKAISKVFTNDHLLYSSNYVLYIFHYCKKLYELLEAGDKVHFITREGFFLKKCFDIYIEDKNLKNISTNYLPISRLSIKQLTNEIETLDINKLSSLFGKKTFEKKINTISSFLKITGFTNGEIQSIAKTKCIDINCCYEDIFLTSDFLSIFDDKSFKDMLAKKRKDGLNNLLDYFTDNKRIILADVGWHGSIQNELRNIIDPQKQIIGYYMGTANTNYKIDKNNKRYGILFDCFDDYFYYRHFNDGFLIIEALLRANHGLFTNYSNHYFLDNDSSLETFNSYSNRRQLEMLKIFRDIIDIDKTHPIDVSKLLTIEHDVLLKIPYKSHIIDQFYSSYQEKGIQAQKKRSIKKLIDFLNYKIRQWYYQIKKL